MQERLIGRRYRLVEEIGSGGMADVYKAVDETLGRNVAVKIMHARLAGDPSFAARFQQEAKAAANLQSPYIVNIYDWGQDTDERGEVLYYIVMEYVRGTDLKSTIERHGALPSRQVAEIGAQVCAALSEAHGYDVIHRDIKPHNIMVKPDGTVKVMDFGIARAGNSTMTQTGSVLGSAHYVSPEQAQGRELTAASDLYSLGVVLYEAATGRMPFDGDSPVATALKQVQEQPVRPSLLNPNIDPGLEAVIGYAMAKNPRARYETAESMRRDLLRVSRGEPIRGAHGTADLRGGGVGAGVGGAGGDADATTVLPGVAAGVAGAAVAGGSGVGGGGAAGGGGYDPRALDRTRVIPAVGEAAVGVGGGAGGAVAAGGAVRPNVITSAPKKKSNKAWIWILVIVLVAAAAVGALYATGVLGSKAAVVPKVVGMTQEEAETALETVELTVGEVTAVYSDAVEAGRIISQDPPEGTPVKELGANTAVNIEVSQGVKPYPVPDLAGKTIEEALADLADTDTAFSVQSSGEEYSDEYKEGQIISQTPEAGEELLKGGVITVVVSKGIERVEVPDVKGKSSSDAKSALKEAGFKTKVSESYSDSVAAGVVISQNPKAGVTIEKGTTIDLVVSKGKEVVQVKVPNVIGLSEDSAQTLLENNGLSVDVQYQLTNNSGTVVSQTPASAKKVNKGSTVTIVVDSDGGASE